MNIIKGIFFSGLLAWLFSSCQNKNVNPISPGLDFVSAPIFLKQWGGPGTANGQFGQAGVTKQIGGLAIDSGGNIYVCDTGNNRVEKFDSNGNFILTWGSPGPGNGQFNNPIAVASSGSTLFVVDNGNNRVEAFDSTGIYLETWASGGSGVSQLNNPQGIAVSPMGGFYVVDSGNNRVQEFFFGNGTPVIWGGAGTGTGQFQSPTGIALDSSGNVFVADTLNNRIERFSSGGIYGSAWGSFGANPGEFRSPMGLAFDDKGNLYVADSANGRIQEFDNQGQFVTLWGGQGNNIGQFQIPFWLAITPSPYFFYIADTGADVVKKFGPPKPYVLYPNPVLPGENLTISFNSSSFIGYLVQITDYNNNVVFSSQGQAVAGSNALEWDMTSGGNRVPTGVYLFNLTLGHSEINEKISVVD